MGSDFFFLSEKLKIHNKKRHCGKYRFQDFKPDLFERVQERMLTNKKTAALDEQPGRC